MSFILSLTSPAQCDPLQINGDGQSFNLVCLISSIEKAFIICLGFYGGCQEPSRTTKVLSKGIYCQRPDESLSVPYLKTPPLLSKLCLQHVDHRGQPPYSSTVPQFLCQVSGLGEPQFTGLRQKQFGAHTVVQGTCDKTEHITYRTLDIV